MRHTSSMYRAWFVSKSGVLIMGWQMAMSAISSGLSAMQQMKQARAREEQEAIKQRQFEADKQMARIRELQEEAQTERALRATKGRNSALAAAKGLDAGASGTFLALKDDSEEQAQFDVANIKLYGISQREKAHRGVLASKSAASASGSSLFANLSSTLFSGLTRMNDLR